MSIIKLFNPKCPKCGSRNTKTLKEGFFKQLRRFMIHIMFFITILFVKRPKKQYVCRDCGFTWSEL